MKKALFTLLAVVLLTLANASEARAWGAAHASYTYHSPGGGFTHSSSSAAYGPYGEHSSSRSTSYNPYTGFSHTGYGQTSSVYGSASHSSSAYGGYGGFSGGIQGAYGSSASYAGAYRRW